MKTPQRLFLIFIIVSLFTALTLSYVHGILTNRISRYLYSTISRPSSDLLLARYDLYSGRITDSIEEYQSVVLYGTSTESDLARTELNNLLRLQKTQIGQWMGFLVNLTWSASSRLYLFATILIPVWLLVLFFGLIQKRPVFAILPFNDNSDRGEKLQGVLQDRMREILWRAKYPNSDNALISDKLELPLAGMSSEGDTVDTVALLETALNFSFGISNLPLSKLLNSLRLWFEQPKYLVRGYFERNHFTYVHIVLIERKSGNVVRIWNNKVEDDSALSQLSDAIIYPLLFHFSSNLQANNWNALQALHEGLENFQLSQEDRDISDYVSRARSSMERALAFDPGYLLARYNLGLIALSVGDNDKAREQFREISLISKDIQLEIRAKYNYGVALFHVAQDWAYYRAAETFENLLIIEETKDNKFDVLIRSSLALTYARMAGRSKKEQTDLVTRAIREAEIILADHDASVDAKTNSFASIGYANLAVNNKDMAINSFKRATELSPNSVMALLGLGDAYIKVQRKEDAIAVLHRAEVLSPANGYASYRIGCLYRDTGEIDRAIEALKRASGLSVAHVVLGKIYQNEALYQDALDEFRKAVQINQRQTEAWVNIAWTILILGDPTFYLEAERAARRAVQLELNEGQHWHRHAILAKCLVENEKYELALHEAKIAVKLGPEKSQAYYYLAVVQYHLDEYSGARENLQNAMKFDPKGEWQDEVKQLIAKIDKHLNRHLQE